MPPARRPWPMKWIVLAIVLCVGPYTYLTLRYRKPGVGYLPYEDAQQRSVLAQAGYVRISLHPEWPADPKPLGTDVSIASAPGGLPAELGRTLTIERPLLAHEIAAAEAGPVVSATEPYRVRFSAVLADDREVLADAKLYYKPGEIVIVPTCERLTGGLIARTRAGVNAAVTLLTLQPGSLPAGTYRVLLAGAASSKAWTVQVH